MEKKVKGRYILGRFFSNRDILIHGIILLSISIVYNVYTFYSQLPIDWRDNVSVSLEGIELNRWISMPLEIVGAILVANILTPYREGSNMVSHIIKKILCYVVIFVSLPIISALITFLFL